MLSTLFNFIAGFFKLNTTEQALLNVADTIGNTLEPLLDTELSKSGMNAADVNALVTATITVVQEAIKASTKKS